MGKRAASGVGVGGWWRRPAGAGGPPPSRAGSVGVSVPRGVGRGWDRRRGGVACGLVSPSCLACPPPPVQVPSASRRGGLKTLWGSPVRLGSGRSGPWGGGFPSPPDSAAHPTPPGPGLLRHAMAFARPSGGGYPGGPVGPCVCVCPVSLGVWGGQVGTPWAPVGLSELRPSRGGRWPDAPLSNLSDLLGVWSRLSLTGRPEAPLRGKCAVPGGGRPSGGWPP